MKEDISVEARDLIHKLLNWDPNKRLKIPEILAHPWMQDIDEEMKFFNEQEIEQIRKDFLSSKTRFNRNGPQESIGTSRNTNTDRHKTDQSEATSECFTEQRLETTGDEMMRNVSSKSLILAPFNSTMTHISTSRMQEMNKMTVSKAHALYFEPRCWDVDRQYEINNNGDVDNGVYNKFVSNTIRNSEDGDVAEEAYSSDSDYDQDDGLFDEPY